MIGRVFVRVATAAGLLLGAAAIAGAGEAHLYFAPGAWIAKAEGDGATGKPGGGFNVADDLAADGVDSYPGIDFLARLGHHRIVGGYSDGKVNGDKLGSSIELRRQRLFYGYSFLSAGVLDVTALVGGDGYDVKTKAAKSTAAHIGSPAPAVGLSIGIRPPIVPVRFYAEGVYSSMKISGVDTRLTDLSASFDWYFIPVVKLLGFQIGYRVYDLKSHDTGTGEKSNYRFRGPFAGLVFRI
ncbi:MAG: hypothetical protein HY049_10065 [Acidobacteria bacterium]|nr:hypothetical protein [Acidobacteriota bacterium]